MILDSNPAGLDHWLRRLFVEERPQGFELFHQPGGRGAEAENLANLPAGYYERLASSMPADWCRVYVDSEWGFAFDGRSVFTEYSDTVHTSPQVLDPLPHSPVTVGVDFGLAGSAAVFLQRDARGRYLLIHELVAEQTGVETFGRLLALELAEAFPGNAFAARGRAPWPPHLPECDAYPQGPGRRLSLPAHQGLRLRALRRHAAEG